MIETPPPVPPQIPQNEPNPEPDYDSGSSSVSPLRLVGITAVCVLALAVVSVFGYLGFNFLTNSQSPVAVVSETEIVDIEEDPAGQKSDFSEDSIFGFESKSNTANNNKGDMLKLNSYEFMDSYKGVLPNGNGEYSPYQGKVCEMEFLLLDLTITNTRTSDAEVGFYDFRLNAEETTGHEFEEYHPGIHITFREANKELGDEALFKNGTDDEGFETLLPVTLKPGETVSGKIIFGIPTGSTEIELKFRNFEGAHLSADAYITR